MSKAVLVVPGLFFIAVYQKCDFYAPDFVD